MYYHGSETPSGGGGEQATRVALSEDGLHFTAHPALLGRPYFRVFQWGSYHYALAMPGVFYRSRDGLTNFEAGPTLFTRNIRHTALKGDGQTLAVLFTKVGGVPAGILLVTVPVT